MITFQEARHIAETTINKYPLADLDSLVILDDETIEKPYAWIFFYNSKKFIDTNEFQYAIAGNAPLFVSKNDGQISTYRTGLNVEEMIAEYEKENKT